jgi:flavin reductase (DIM6/NTAB) family NADH-FMN oxidoreductase RutF
MILNPHEMSPRDLNKVANGTVVPRPIAWVSSTDGAGNYNLAPFSYFNVVSSDPLTLIFSVGPKANGTKKDTRRNVEATGEFVINIVNEATAEAMNVSATVFDYGVSEFEMAGLTPLPGVKVNVPRVGEAPVSFECTLRQIVEVGNNAVIFGDVQLIHISGEVYDGNYVNTEKLRPIGRLAGNSYCRVTELFQLVRR